MPCSDEPHGSPQWIVEDGQVLGEIALRHWYREEIDVGARIEVGGPRAER